MKAWHFLRNNKKIGYEDGRKVRTGVKYSCKGELSLCNNGMHASGRLIDALQYAPGNIICRVELSCDMLHGDDKVCARSRKVLWMIDGERLLHEFACNVAASALRKAKVTDKRCWDAIKTKNLWLDGKVTDQELAAARDAAWDAAGAAWAAGAAARAAAGAAAWAAARAAAGDAARDARAAAGDAAGAAGAAAWAARAAARAAAGDAERLYQNRILTRMVNKQAKSLGLTKGEP